MPFSSALMARRTVASDAMLVYILAVASSHACRSVDLRSGSPMASSSFCIASSAAAILSKRNSSALTERTSLSMSVAWLLWLFATSPLASITLRSMPERAFWMDSSNSASGPFWSRGPAIIWKKLRTNASPPLLIRWRVPAWGNSDSMILRVFTRRGMNAFSAAAMASPRAVAPASRIIRHKRMISASTSPGGMSKFCEMLSCTVALYWRFIRRRKPSGVSRRNTLRMFSVRAASSAILSTSRLAAS